VASPGPTLNWGARRTLPLRRTGGGGMGCLVHILPAAARPGGSPRSLLRAWLGSGPSPRCPGRPAPRARSCSPPGCVSHPSALTGHGGHRGAPWPRGRRGRPTRAGCSSRRPPPGTARVAFATLSPVPVGMRAAQARDGAIAAGGHAEAAAALRPPAWRKDRCPMPAWTSAPGLPLGRAAAAVWALAVRDARSPLAGSSQAPRREDKQVTRVGVAPCALGGAPDRAADPPGTAATPRVRAIAWRTGPSTAWPSGSPSTPGRCTEPWVTSIVLGIRASRMRSTGARLRKSRIAWRMGATGRSSGDPGGSNAMRWARRGSRSRPGLADPRRARACPRPRRRPTPRGSQAKPHPVLAVQHGQIDDGGIMPIHSTSGSRASGPGPGPIFFSSAACILPRERLVSRPVARMDVPARTRCLPLSSKSLRFSASLVDPYLPLPS
jgi:hypothetical protein